MKILTSFLIFLLFMSSDQSMSADADGSNKIRLMGELLDGKNKRVTVKDIEAIGTIEADVFNPYEKRSDRYTGVWMKDFVARYAKATTNQLTTTAIDDYSVTFNKTDWTNLKILIATQVNGQYIGFDKKGPLRIAFVDFDEEHELYEENLPKWTWMIKKIEFK